MEGDFLGKKEAAQKIENCCKSEDWAEKYQQEKKPEKIHADSNRSLCQWQRKSAALWNANLGIRKCQKESNYPTEFENTGEGMSRLDWPSHCSKRCTTEKEIQVYFYSS